MIGSVDDVAEVIRGQTDDAGSRTSSGPFLVGIAGAVAVGKSTLAATLAARLAPASVEVVATDGFLRTNDDLAERGLLMQKGFPPSYDEPLMQRFITELRAGRRACMPEYSHVTYDRVPGTTRVIRAGTDVVIIEGVNALQPTIAPLLDLRIFLDAEEPTIRGWFIERFLEQVELATADGASFYRRFMDMPAEQQRQLAEGTWVGINLVNLVEHIHPTRAFADLVLTKSADHSFV